MRRYLTIRTKFTGLALAVVLPILIFFMIYVPMQQSVIFESELLTRYEEQAKAAGLALAAGISTENFHLIGEGVESVKSNKGLRYFLVLDPQNEPIVWDNPGGLELNPEILNALPRIQLEASVVRIRQSLVFDGKLHGTLFMGISTLELDEHIEKSRFFSYVVGFLSAVLAAVLMWMLSSRLTLPLANMTRAASGIADGDLDQIVEVKSNDEVGVLARAFNVMTRKLQASYIGLRESKEFSDNLIAAVPSSLAAVDESGCIASVNKSFCSLFQMRPDLVERRPLAEVLDELNFPGSLVSSIVYGKEFADVMIVVPSPSISPDGERKMTLRVSLVNMHAEKASDNPSSKRTLLVIEDVTDRVRVQEEKESVIRELQEAVANVKTLSGLLPICASCKKIRDEKGAWNVLEKYIHDHSDAKFTHGVCPECAKRLYSSESA